MEPEVGEAAVERLHEERGPWSGTSEPIGQRQDMVTHPELKVSAIWRVLARRSTHERSAQETSMRWVESAGLCQSPAESANLHQSRPGLLAAWCHPDASEADLSLVAMWMSWLFLLDDRIDESTLGRDADQLEFRLRDLHAVALGMSGPVSPMGRGLAEIIERACEEMPSWWQFRFRRNVAEYLAACVWQAAHRQAGQVPTLEEFPSRRRAFGAVMPSFDRTEGVLLPSSIHYSRPYQDLLFAAADLVCWTNDLMTADKEAAHGDLHNLVLVTAHHKGLERQAAARMVAAACEDRLHVFSRAREELAELLQARAEVSAEGVELRADDCATVLLAWVRGHLEWGLHTPRYHPEDDEAGRSCHAGSH
ncbi:(-)-delta-cadinene synthase [Streptantibioticus parmotrematis]|nr:terpene synthase [Streptantibioticus parmotrematis]